jgi:hypothetical protein
VQRTFGLILHDLAAVVGNRPQRRARLAKSMNRRAGYTKRPTRGGHVAVVLAELFFNELRR